MGRYVIFEDMKQSSSRHDGKTIKRDSCRKVAITSAFGSTGLTDLSLAWPDRECPLESTAARTTATSPPSRRIGQHCVARDGVVPRFQHPRGVVEWSPPII